MKKFALQISLVLSLSLMTLPGFAQAQSPMQNLDLGAVECNWGVLTMQAIAAGFGQGTHSSDPSGDGVGNADPDKHDPRVGLPNVLGDSPDLEVLCEFLGCILFPDDAICQ